MRGGAPSQRPFCLLPSSTMTAPVRRCSWSSESRRAASVPAAPSRRSGLVQPRTIRVTERMPAEIPTLCCGDSDRTECGSVGICQRTQGRFLRFVGIVSSAYIALAAASSITLATSFGCDNITTWLVGSVIVVALICAACLLIFRRNHVIVGSNDVPRRLVVPRSFCRPSGKE